MFLLLSLWLRHIKRCATAEARGAGRSGGPMPGNLESALRWVGVRVGNARPRGLKKEQSQARDRLPLAHHAADHETDIGWALAEAPHEVREPFTTEWNIDAHMEAVPRQRRLEIAPDAVQHLELIAIR